MLSEEHKRILLTIAGKSITHGIRHGIPLIPDSEKLPEELRPERATFVTIELHGNLRGCIGSLEPRLPLAEDVARNAFQAAFRDPRFSPLSANEAKDIEIHVSVLSLPEPMEFDSEQDLINQLRPGVDGIVLEDGWHRGTFLPAVWDDLPEKEDFFQHLKLKAGLSPSYWSDTIKAYRYTTDYFP